MSDVSEKIDEVARFPVTVCPGGSSEAMGSEVGNVQSLHAVYELLAEAKAQRRVNQDSFAQRADLRRIENSTSDLNPNPIDIGPLCIPAVLDCFSD
ncbi:hypothetical protein AU198_19080 [Mycobacterium sp. GA-1199]|nr:hypothetical protein AU198_19080 [Mycobacterium sp. GA-1199]